MDKEKFNRILKHNLEKEIEIKRACSEFYINIGKEGPTVIADIESMANVIFDLKDYKIVHIPINSEEIGACIITVNCSNFLVINTSRSVANNNYSIAHEIYHILIQKESLKAEIYNENYEDEPDEMMANAFAGNILMPKEDFISSFDSFKGLYLKNKKDNGTKYGAEFCTIIMLMNQYKTTYMSVVIRCYELGLIKNNDDDLLETILQCNTEEMEEELCQLYASARGVDSIMRKTRIDDFKALMNDVNMKKEEIEHSVLFDQEAFDYKINGLIKAYEAIKENE